MVLNGSTLFKVNFDRYEGDDQETISIFYLSLPDGSDSFSEAEKAFREYAAGYGTNIISIEQMGRVHARREDSADPHYPQTVYG